MPKVIVAVFLCTEAGAAYFHLIVNRGALQPPRWWLMSKGIPRLPCCAPSPESAAGIWVWECEMQWNEIGHLALPVVTRQKYASVFAQAAHGRHSHTLKGCFRAVAGPVSYFLAT